MGGTQSKKWVLLAAGSEGWINYRHQACVCHAYQMAHGNGIPDEQIVVMMYDDIANNEANQNHRGEIINEPGGPNVYQGVLKDYINNDVSVQNFLAVLRGDEANVTKHAGGPKKVLKSGRNDTIFIYLSGHGGKGVFAFPNTNTLHASDLVDTINEMSGRHQFSKMVIYVESCFSGSMIDHLPKNTEVYGVSASSPDESSYAYFLDEDRWAYLSNEFTAYWLLHNEKSDLTKTTFWNQFVYLREKVQRSTPHQYGNITLRELYISDFLGRPDSRTQAERARQAKRLKQTHLTLTNEVPLIIQRSRIQCENNIEKKRALQRDYDNLMKMKERIATAVQNIAMQSCPERGPRALIDTSRLTQLKHLKHVAEHFRQTFSKWHEEQYVSFVMAHMSVFVNLIESGVDVERIKDAITRVHIAQGPSSGRY
ncbi:legumain-like [Colossoma macropomum]|uniref:legumain-like n=1 Tax=Colossoma macropomum TaxID=42526 RepID=UPI0018655724|nr:legumain-like [Colossoma macropomum]